MRLQWERSRGRPGSFGFRRKLSLSLLTGFWVSAALADAPPSDPPPPDWLVSYDVGATCPSEEGFRATVSERLAGRSDRLGRVRLSVSIVREPLRRGWQGQLQVTDAAGVVTTRDVVDVSCIALVQALGLIAALSADAAPSLDAESSGAAPAALGGVPREASGPLDTALPLTQGSTGRAAVRVGPVVLASIRSAVVPEPAMSIELGVVTEWATGAFWAPRLELTGTQLESQEVALRGSDVQMRFAARLVTLGVCPARLAYADWSVRPCLDLEAGRLTGYGQGRGVIRPQRRHALWAAPGLSLRADVTPGGGPLQLATSFGVQLPLARHEFFFAPDVQGFEVPALGWRGAGAVALLF